MNAVEKIHRVIDPLFLNELRAEFEQRLFDPERLKELHNHIASLKFFDPACGSGEFLIEIHASLRRLEEEILEHVPESTARISGAQFFGIESSSSSAKKLRKNLPNSHIRHGNALLLDWSKLLPRGADFIIGKPSAFGFPFQTPEQKADVSRVFVNERGKPYAKNGKLDYAAGWIFKAAQFMHNRKTRAAFVLPESLCQSEQAYLIWKPLFERFGVHIDFAYRPLKWSRQTRSFFSNKSVIVGFSSARNDQPRRIFDGDQSQEVANINAYLLDAPNIFVTGQMKPLCEVPEIHRGNQPTDGRNLIIEADQYDDFIRREPRAQKFIRRFMMGREFVKNLPRYCLWLKDATPEEIQSMPLVAERVSAVKRFRESSTFDKTRKLSKTPHLFREQITPDRFIAIPKVLSDKRAYLPIAWLDSSTIAGDQIFMIPDAELFHFGILESSVHMIWTRALGGQYSKGFCYSKTIIYNNFPWCEPTAKQRAAIENTAQKILDARKKYGDLSLADLYDNQKMPSELRAEHIENDLAVLDAYGFDKNISETEILSRLMSMYDDLLTSMK